MNSRNKKLLRHMVTILLVACLAGVIAYFGGAALGRSAIAGHDVTLNAWKAAYRNLTIIVAVLTWMIASCWYICAYSVFSVTGPFGVGKRMTWGLFGLAVLGVSIAVPILYSIVVKAFVLPVIILVIFPLLFVGGAYWGVTIWATPANYKYTPIGSLRILAPNTGK